MDTTKPFYLSRTFWSALVMAGFGLFGVTDADLPFTGDQLTDAIVTVGTALSFALTVFFRARSTSTNLSVR